MIIFLSKEILSDALICMVVNLDVVKELNIYLSNPYIICMVINNIHIYYYIIYIIYFNIQI